MNTELKSVTLEIKDGQPTIEGEPTWDLTVLARDVAGNPVSGVPVRREWQVLTPPDESTGKEGEVRCTLAERPESRVHSPPGRLGLEAERDGDTVTFRVVAYDGSNAKRPGVEVEFVSDVGTVEPRNGVTTATAGAECRLSLT